MTTVRTPDFFSKLPPALAATHPLVAEIDRRDDDGRVVTTLLFADRADWLRDTCDSDDSIECVRVYRRDSAGVWCRWY